VQLLEDTPRDDMQDDQPVTEPPSLETNGNVENEPEKPENVELNGKVNQKARRRKSLPAKQEYKESVSQNSPNVPSYMAATESAKAKLRAQAAAKAAEEGVENGFTRRQSIPSATAKPSLHSPRVHKPSQANGKGVTKPNKSQISPRDGKHIYYCTKFLLSNSSLIPCMMVPLVCFLLTYL
ncbi:IQ-DOMAIN 31-like protein, partial [Tanacetum coccineum]